MTMSVSHGMGAGKVCQIAGCTTSHEEIEAELQTYLGGYCQACGKNRDGRLCGCAFPCSLTFKGQMLNMIHNLLGINVPIGMKHINVCHKHSDLLKQAREKCLQIRDGTTGSSGLSTPAGSLISKPPVKQKDQRKKVNLERKTGDITFNLESLEDSGETILGSIDASVTNATGVDSGDNVTSIVYTDEGGREQKMVGKIVYQTDSKGQSNIIIQEVQEDEEEEEDKIVKLNFSDIDGYMTQIQNKPEQVTVDEDIEQRLEAEIEGREARMEEELDFEASETVAKQPLPTRRIETPRVQNPVHQPLINLTESLSTNSVISYSIPIDAKRNIIQCQDSSFNSKPVIYSNKPNISVPSSIKSTEKGVDIEKEASSINEKQLLKIQYKEYNTKVLASELSHLVSNTELCDTMMICGDGNVLTSSLLLSPAIPWLSSLLDSVIRIDQYKTVILPSQVSVESVKILNSVLCSSNPPNMGSDQILLLKEVCDLLYCNSILDLINIETEIIDCDVTIASGKQKRKASVTPTKKKAKQPKLSSNSSPVDASKSYASVKLEKTDLNPDYLDPTGLVRLSSVDEMAMHYCLYCPAKFKKYNQAITHYDLCHNLPAALACDQCDNVFRDMFTCVKHKHEVHGQFDVNFQCYICKDVSYSRFRLGTHIKECHKDYHGEFMCRACGMKFPAQYYLTNHQKESHSDKANTCSICGKTFSGKRYLTMHIKANHETQAGTPKKLSGSSKKNLSSEESKDDVPQPKTSPSINIPVKK